MLTEAGGTHLVAGLDQQSIEQALERVGPIAHEAQSTSRAVRQARATASPPSGP
jgi:UDP-N-acetylmuramoylalanine-D-glutamate ligase